MMEALLIIMILFGVAVGYVISECLRLRDCRRMLDAFEAKSVAAPDLQARMQLAEDAIEDLVARTNIMKGLK